MSASGCEAGFHDTSMAMPRGPFAGFEGWPNRRRPRESPRGSSRPGGGDGLRPQPRPETGSSEEASASKRAPGERRGLRADPRIRKGISQGFGFGRFLDGGGLQGLHRSTPSMGPAARRLSKGRPEGLRPRCEPWRRRGFGRAGSAREAAAGLRSRQLDPTGIGEGLAPPPRPTGDRTGLDASLRYPGKAAGAFHAPPRSRSRPARDGLATQRRQSRLGQVGAGGDTGPHYRSGRPSTAAPPVPPRSSIAALSA
jgi:hypothetical protein